MRLAGGFYHSPEVLPSLVHLCASLEHSVDIVLPIWRRCWGSTHFSKFAKIVAWGFSFSMISNFCAALSRFSVLFSSCTTPIQGRLCHVLWNCTARYNPTVSQRKVRNFCRPFNFERTQWIFLTLHCTLLFQLNLGSRDSNKTPAISWHGLSQASLRSIIKLAWYLTIETGTSACLEDKQQLLLH